MSGTFLVDVQLGSPWRRMVADARSVRWRYGAVEVGVRRSVDGWLRDAYPISLDDVEIYVVGQADRHVLTAAVAQLARSILNVDRHCRRVVFAVTAGDDGMVSAARAVGFRYVLDVDVPGGELSLLVSEADWATTRDHHLDIVPGS